jgi:hypothetical protein
MSMPLPASLATISNHARLDDDVHGYYDSRAEDGTPLRLCTSCLLPYSKFNIICGQIELNFDFDGCGKEMGEQELVNVTAD